MAELSHINRDHFLLKDCKYEPRSHRPRMQACGTGMSRSSVIATAIKKSEGIHRVLQLLKIGIVDTD
jgi:hypothetical protein